MGYCEDLTYSEGHRLSPQDINLKLPSEEWVWVSLATWGPWPTWESRKCFEIACSNSFRSLSINLRGYLDDHLLTKYCHVISSLTLSFCLWSSCNAVWLGSELEACYSNCRVRCWWRLCIEWGAAVVDRSGWIPVEFRRQSKHVGTLVFEGWIRGWKCDNKKVIYHRFDLGNPRRAEAINWSKEIVVSRTGSAQTPCVFRGTWVPQ